MINKTIPIVKQTETIITKTLNIRFEDIVVVNNAIKKEHATEIKNTAKFRYTELGEPVVSTSSS